MTSAKRGFEQNVRRLK